jgi:crossover junction endodeoxyribonuclease RusA
MNTIQFTVPGEPASKERPRFGNRRTYTPKATQDAEARVIEAFDLAYPLHLPLTCPIWVSVEFYNGNRRRRDLDNQLKLVLDALNKVAYGDDWQVTRLESEKFYDKGNPRTVVSIWEVTQ